MRKPRARRNDSGPVVQATGRIPVPLATQQRPREIEQLVWAMFMSACLARAPQHGIPIGAHAHDADDAAEEFWKRFG